MNHHARSAVPSGAGHSLAGAARLVAAVRAAPKPLHPRGTTWSAELVRRGGSTTGVPWFDEPGTEQALVRRSRAIGLPATWPDVHGLAIRAGRDDGGVTDVLLASTGWGPLGRFVLHPGRRPESMFFGSLLPYRSRFGPVLLGALPRDETAWDLTWAAGRGPWTPFARLLLHEQLPERDISFDAVLNRPAGLEQYGAAARLRLPAYRAARETRETREPGIADQPAGTPRP
jgi:hypothetical protein